MKMKFIPLLAGLVLSCIHASTDAQDFKEHISKQFTQPQGTLAIYNIFGSIKVEGYAGDKVVMEIDKTISAKNNEIVQAGKEEFRFEIEQKADSIIAYIAEPYDSRPHTNKWNENRQDRKIHYKYKLDFIIKVPFGMNLRVSTVNDGNITVENVAGTLSVHNVNGAISVLNAKGVSDIHTINGNVTINYLTNPPEASNYYTLNGTLTATFPSNLSADLQFKSMNGEFYTDFPNAEFLPITVTKTQKASDHGTTYKLNKNTAVRIGSGGKIFKFETMNGNIYIKKS